MNGAYVGFFFFCYIVLLILMIATLMNCVNVSFFSLSFCCLWGVDDHTLCELCQLLGLFNFLLLCGFCVIKNVY